MPGAPPVFSTASTAVVVLPACVAGNVIVPPLPNETAFPFGSMTYPKTKLGPLTICAEALDAIPGKSDQRQERWTEELRMPHWSSRFPREQNTI